VPGPETLIPAFYVLVMPAWLAVSAWARRRATAWAFTPRWHRRAVPAFRAFFLLTLPLEFLLAERVFLPPVFIIGAVATLGWLAWRARFLARAPAVLPRAESVRYNLAYVANLGVFALACHSFVCLVVMLNVSVPLLLVREARVRRDGCLQRASG
jgi:hypothetical protein